MHSEELSRVISRSMYGLIITTALLIALEHTAMTSWSVALSILTSLLSICIAEAYTEGVGTHIRQGDLERTEKRHIFRESLYIFVGSTLPLLVFILSGVGVWDISTAYLIAKVSIIVLLMEYGYIYGRRIGRSRLGALRVALLNIVLVTLIIFFKEFVKV